VKVLEVLIHSPSYVSPIFFNDHHKSYGLTTLPSWLFLKYISSSISILCRLSRIPYIIPDRRSFFFGKFTCVRAVRGLLVGHPRHQGVPRIGTMQNTHLHCGLIKEEETTVRDQARTVRPQARTVRSLKNQKKPKGNEFDKCIFSVLTDCLGCMAGQSTTALSDIWRHI
jgi:hypothetical protein